MTEEDKSIDEFLSANELEQLVRSSVHEAVDGSVVPPANANVSVLVGEGVRLAIKRGVMIAVRELVGGQLLAGQLKQAAEKVKKAAEEAEALWNAIKEHDKEVVLSATPSWDGITATEVVVEEPEAPASDHKEIHKILSFKSSGAKVASAAIVDENSVKDAAAAQTPPEDEVVTTSTDIIVNGIRVIFSKSANPAFKPFLRAFVEQIKKGPVRPIWVYKLAQDHGWLVTSKGTIAYQIENHIGELGKWRDEKGDSWWSLPGDTETPAGTKRTIK